jgi:hypothetical protein
MLRLGELRYLRPSQSCGRAGQGAEARQSAIQGTIMLFTIFCCFSTGLAVYCILTRVHRKAIELAVRMAVREVEKEYESQTVAAAAKLNARLTAKEGELAQARTLVRLHEAVPVPVPRSPSAASAPQKPASGAAKVPERKLKQDPLNVFEMSRPFTDTSYDALLASSDVVKVEPAGG